MRSRSRFAKVILVVLALLLVLVVVGPLLVPYPPIAGAVSAQQFADPDSHFVTVNNNSVHYKRYGQGEPMMILLHGTLLNTNTWHKIVEPLAQHGTVIAYDRPSFGLTARPLLGDWIGESPYGYEAQTDLLIGLMDALSIQKAILIGNSMGGSIAALAAQRYPERVQALILAAPAQTSHGTPDGVRWLFNTPQLRRIGPLFVRSQIENFGRNLYLQSWHDQAKIDWVDWTGFQNLMRTQDWDRSLWELVAAAQPFETLLHWETIVTPTLLITGDDDRVLGTQANINLSKKMPNAHLVVIPACGHMPQEECPGAFIDAVRQWLKDSR